MHSIPNSVMKRGPTHGARHGKYNKSIIRLGMRGRDAVGRSTLKENIFTGIHDRFLRDLVYPESQLAIGWTEQECKEWDELAQEDHTYHFTPEEKKDTKDNGILL